MAPSLEELPPELLDMIANICMDSDGGENDLFALHPTSRTIQGATRHCWLDSYFSNRYVDIDRVKMGQLKDIGSVPELARTTTKFSVRCKDDSVLFNMDDGSPRLSAELMELSFMMTLAIQNFKNVDTIEFYPTLQGISEERTHQGRMMIDFSNTFSFILLAAQACGLRPQHICRDAKTEGYFVEFHLKTWQSMPQLSDCFSNLKTFDNCIDINESFRIKPKYAKRFANGINSMQSLTCLVLDFSHTTNEDHTSSFFKELAEGVSLPHLASMELEALVCRVRDLMHFLVKHSSTLKSCRLSCITTLENEATMLFRIMLEKLRSSFSLDKLCVERLDDAKNGSRLTFPNVDRTTVREHENEDGFLVVDVSEGVELHGLQEVQEGLANMLSCVAAQARTLDGN